jgi:hypothetical protein
LAIRLVRKFAFEKRRRATGEAALTDFTANDFTDAEAPCYYLVGAPRASKEHLTPEVAYVLAWKRSLAVGT